MVVRNIRRNPFSFRIGCAAVLDRIVCDARRAIRAADVKRVSVAARNEAGLRNADRAVFKFDQADGIVLDRLSVMLVNTDWMLRGLPRNQFKRYIGCAPKSIIAPPPHCFAS